MATTSVRRDKLRGRLGAQRRNPDHRAAGLWLAAAAVLAALNLRPAIVAVGPLTTMIETGTGLSSTATSLLTTLPLVCFGVFAAAAAPLSGRLGLDRAILAATLLLVVGIAIRLFTPLALLFAGSAVAAGGIALGNVLVPAIIKKHYPQRIGAMMALYSVALQTGAAAAAGVAAPLTTTLHLGWRPGLALWGVPAVLAASAWLARARRVRTPMRADHEQWGAIWRSSLGWAAAVFIGLQSAVYFALTAWLPTLLHDNGLSETRAGLMLSIVGVAGIAGGLPMPLLAARLRNQSSLVLVTVACFTVGLLGLLVDPAGPTVLWSILLGLAQGSALSLALTLFTLRSSTPAGAARLSGMAQTAGYLIAATGPFAAGLAHSLTDGWTVPTVVLLAALVPLTGAGLLLARPRTLEDELDHHDHRDINTKEAMS